jgi:hypothetical protein
VKNERSAITGSYISGLDGIRHKQAAAIKDANASSKTRSARSAKTGRYVTVNFGGRATRATVVEGRNGRIEVEIAVDGASEPLRTSYSVGEIQFED